MPDVVLQRPSDQPRGALRLISELLFCLGSEDLTEFRMVVAFAKQGPLRRLLPAILRWRSSGKAVRAIIGVDQRGTSIEALQIALAYFDEIRLVRLATNEFAPTFHPKLYIFTGAQRAVAYWGSNNLTLGGTEINSESFVRLTLTLPAERQLNSDFEACWDDAVAISIPLTVDVLRALEADGTVVHEDRMRPSALRPQGHQAHGHAADPQFPTLLIAPPSPLPKPPTVAGPATAPAQPPFVQQPQPALPRAIGAQALVIQITPHHNGEIFLSKIAVDQDPGFFGWPFTGVTVPKRGRNAGYPQRLPDPMIDLTIYDAQANRIERMNPFSLNTVYYARNHEIRVTVPPRVAAMIPPESIMVMSETANQAYDYIVDIYLPGSQRYAQLLAVCNQTMPPGGRPSPRRFGWT